MVQGFIYTKHLACRDMHIPKTTRLTVMEVAFCHFNKVELEETAASCITLQGGGVSANGSELTFNEATFHKKHN